MVTTRITKEAAKIADQALRVGLRRRHHEDRPLRVLTEPRHAEGLDRRSNSEGRSVSPGHSLDRFKRSDPATKAEERAVLSHER